MLEVISLGAGVQSTTMALMAAHGAITPMPDAAIFADTGAEPPEVYEHLEWLKSGNVLPFPVRVVQLSNLLQDLTATASGANVVFGRQNGYVAAPFYTGNPNGSVGRLTRECTEEYKIKALACDAKRLLGLDPLKAIRSREPLIRQWVGITVDERHRVKFANPKWRAVRWPFLSRVFADDHQDIWMRRWDCEQWLRRHDYPVPMKSACTFCPFRSNAEWRALRDHSPEGWKQAVEVDRLIRDMPDTSRARLREGGKVYVHRDAKPLEEVDLDLPDQEDLWSAECEGMCGL